jgi:hypothetical protein
MKPLAKIAPQRPQLIINNVRTVSSFGSGQNVQGFGTTERWRRAGGLAHCISGKEDS